MKKLVRVSAIVSLVALVALGGYAQPKYTNQSYSSSNYKMPNNARIAKKYNLDNSTSYEYKNAVKEGQQSAANYKNSFAKVEDNGGKLPISPEESDNSFMAGNYKMQFKGTRKVKKVEFDKNPAELPVEHPIVKSPTEE